MSIETSVVVTSIGSPELPALQELAKGASNKSYKFIVIGDTKSPDSFVLEGCSFFSIQNQIETGFKFAQHCPTRHYARKNIGYLIAISRGAQKIIETDDDNIPLDDFWNDHTPWIETPYIENHGWVNVYKYFSNELIWPRGLPLDSVREQTLPDYEALPQKLSYCPIQQGLADLNPDVDAVYRLTLPLPINFQPGRQIAISNGSLCPFNSQNTVWFPEAYPLLYLPSYCSFRMTDIWRSFVAQRIAWENGWSVLFYSPTVYQERNEHNLMRDFEEEIPGYINNRKICDELMGLSLASGESSISKNLLACYTKLVELGIVGKEELPLLEMWLEDLAEVC